MESPLFEIDLLTALEPGIPGGGTPPSTAGETPPATEARFMERSVFQELDTYWDHERWSEECSERPSPRPSPGGRGRIVPAGFEGLGRVLAGTSRVGSDGWISGMSPCGICGSLSLRERVGVRVPVSPPATASWVSFMGWAGGFRRPSRRFGGRLSRFRVRLRPSGSRWQTRRGNCRGVDRS